MPKNTSRYQTLKEWGHPDVQYQHGPAREDTRLVIDGFKVPAVTSVVIEDDAEAACPKVTVTFLAASVRSAPTTLEEAFAQQAGELFEDIYQRHLQPRLERLEARLDSPKQSAPVQPELTAEHALLAAKFGWTPDVLRGMTPEEVAFYVANAPA